MESTGFKHKCENFNLEAKIQTFKLKGDKDKINNFFKNNDNELIPLIYINNNLFNNYTLFNPNRVRPSKNTDSLPQMIGFINIYSTNPQLLFNSDRTNLIENEFSDKLSYFLAEFNAFIQKEGNKYAKELREDFNILTTNKIYRDEFDNTTEKAMSYIKSEVLLKKFVKVIIEKDKIIYNFFTKTFSIYIVDKAPSHKLDITLDNGNKNNENNKSNGNQQLQVAKIILKKDTYTYEIPSIQLNLLDYIKEATNSENKQVDIEKYIIVKVDNVLCQTKILESINTPCIKCITYIYNDKNTGILTKELTINFIQKMSEINGESNPDDLFMLPTNKTYYVNYNNYVINLKNQISTLYKNFDDYYEVITCSLRAIFDISLDSLIKANIKFSNDIRNAGGLLERVEKVVEITSKRENMSEISKSTGIDYDSLKNILTPQKFRLAIKDAHLGAHKGPTYLTKQEVDYVVKKAMYFIVLINELINNNNIK